MRDSDEHFDASVEADAKRIEEITRRLEEMQRELDARAPVHSHLGDEPQVPAA